jgi:putative ABC transport system permease protein
LVVRTPMEPQSVVPGLRAQLASMNKDMPLARVQTMDQLIEDSVVQEKFRTWLVSGFATIALLLAVIGIYAVISYGVAQQTREIGVRMALGASAADVLKMVLSHGLRLAAAGVALGLIGALAVTRILRSMLFSTSSTDFMSFVLTSVVLLAVALLACYIPALRATKVDPIVALRYE